MNKIYKSNYKAITFWFFILAVFMLIVGLWDNFSIRRLIEGVFFMSVWIIPLSLFVFFTRVLVQEQLLKFPGRKFPVIDISEINRGASFKVAKRAYQSIYILYKKQNQRKNVLFKLMDGLQNHSFYKKYPDLDFIELRFAAFKESTVAELIYDLKQLNPGIAVDEGAKKLVKKHLGKEIS